MRTLVALSEIEESRVVDVTYYASACMRAGHRAGDIRCGSDQEVVFRAAELHLAACRRIQHVHGFAGADPLHREAGKYSIRRE